MDHHNSRDYNIHAFVMCSKNLYDKQSSLGNEYMYYYCNLEITIVCIFKNVFYL